MRLSRCRRLVSFCLVGIASVLPMQLAFAEDAEDAATEEKKSEPAKEEAAPSTADKSHEGLFGALRVGPTASVGVPFLLNYGLDTTWDRRFGAGFAMGRFKRDLNADSQIELYNWDVRARWFPWQGSFFLGAAFGNQGIVGKTTTKIKQTTGGVDLEVPATIRLAVQSKYLTPHLGWFATWDWGFTLGFEVGYQMPMSSKSDLQIAFDNMPAANEEALKNSDDYKKAESDVTKAAESFGKKPVPYINLIRIGWLL